MCTAINLKSKDGTCFFGRNMDIEYNFNQEIVFVPRNYEITNKPDNKKYKTKYAILGMASVISNYPLFADGFNEKGLAIAGLNFPGFAKYNELIDDEKINVAAYDFIMYFLGNYNSVKEVKENIYNISIVNFSFSDNLPIVPLHWMLSDKNNESIVVEITAKGLSVYDNPIGVLSNSPDFNFQLTNLNQYVGLSNDISLTTSWGCHVLNSNGVGLGLKGLPGDFYSTSRFVRASYLKSNIMLNSTSESTLSSFFHILNNVAMVDGAVISNGLPDYTTYTSCMNLTDGIYYYNTYTNNRITGVNIFKENLNDVNIKRFGYDSHQSINILN